MPAASSCCLSQTPPPPLSRQGLDTQSPAVQIAGPAPARQGPWAVQGEKGETAGELGACVAPSPPCCAVGAVSHRGRGFRHWPSGLGWKGLPGRASGSCTRPGQSSYLPTLVRQTHLFTPCQADPPVHTLSGVPPVHTLSGRPTCLLFVRQTHLFTPCQVDPPVYSLSGRPTCSHLVRQTHLFTPCQESHLFTPCQESHLFTPGQADSPVHTWSGAPWLQRFTLPPGVCWLLPAGSCPTP